MAGWVGPTIAVSLVVIALCYLGAIAGMLLAVRKAAEQGAALSKELGEMRREISPALQAFNRLSQDGAEVAALARDEAQEFIYSARRIRREVEEGIDRTRERLADLAAVVDVVQEEIEETALDVTAALRTARTGAGMIGRLRRLILPRRRGAA